jgi:hypothetical protein
MKRLAYLLGGLSVLLAGAQAALDMRAGLAHLNGGQPLPSAFILLEIAVMCGLAGGGVYAWAVRAEGGVRIVWAVAAGLALVGWISGGVIGQGMRVYMAYPLAAAALGFWLAGRFSRLPTEWLRIGVYTVGGVLALCGALLTLADRYPLSGGWISGAAEAARWLVPLGLLIYARHAYAPLANRSDSPALAAHWAALCLLLLLLGMGGLGAITAPVSTRQWTHGTRLDDLLWLWTLYGALAMGLGALNQMAMELAGLRRRVTGLMPFWLVSFGLVGWGLSWLLIGAGQVYLERLAGLSPASAEPLMRPLYAGQVIGAGGVLLGLLIYLLQLYARRPRSDAGRMVD